MSETHVLDEHERAPPEAEEDLEDGEIDDDDDDDVAIISATPGTNEATAKLNVSHEEIVKPLTDIITIDLVNDNAPTPPPIMTQTKSKKPKHMEDDYASSIENAIASALIKKGIEPPMPKIQNGGADAKDADNASGQGQSRSSRRRKRKKQRDEKDKDRKKKSRYESPDPHGPPPLDDENDMDDYEMMNVRGGSPPPISHAPVQESFHDQYESAEDSCSSYESYDSGDAAAATGGSSRRRRRGKKDSRKRRERGGRNRDDGNRGEKRNRRDSGDDKHRQEPRKLELCKFYLMECCAKKDKCSYMHSDFPCKYYYLGMECAQKDTCKFSHGEPLSEQLRNILLKHLDTAPKEILGNFKRISRENAIVQIVKRHEELCKEFGEENVWTPISNLHMNHNRRGGDQQMQQQQQQRQQIQQMQQQQQSLQQQLQENNTGNIPSLLDMVINPPPLGPVGNVTSQNSGPTKSDKQRKSRWAESTGSGGKRPSVEPPSSSAPSYLDLKNLTGILSVEHIEKLSQLGIVNLEQVNQLTFGQLNQIGLTIAEISEIQLNAINMAKLGVTNKSTGGAVASAVTISQSDSSKPPNDIPTSRDVDMRFLPSGATTATNTASNAATETEKDVTMSSNSNSNSSSGVVMVDYSQYLKDSNLSFDRSDIYDDEKDEEQLVIDDGNLDHEEHVAKPTKIESTESSEEKKPADNVLLHRLAQLPNITNTLKNPFNTLYSNTLENKKEVTRDTRDPRDPRDSRSLTNTSNEKPRHLNPFKTNDGFRKEENSADEHNSNDDDEDYYASRSRSRSRTPTRSQSSTPEASQSPEPQDPAPPRYERPSIYDFSTRQVEEDELRAANGGSGRADKDMRFLPGSGSITDIDLRLPFQPMNYTPATEIDGSITSHLPMTYKVYIVDVPTPIYRDLRQSFKSSDQTADPRLRRILGLPELSQTKTSAAISRRPARKLSNNIASPESDGASPKYYTPPTTTEDSKATKISTSTARVDPRRAAAQATAAAASPATSASTTSTGAIKQNVEIRNLLQKSEWYKNLNSKFKIMVNQQLALVSTELKKFHQDQSPNKIFDISFIMNNSTLQQILTHLGIYIDDNGEVTHVDGDNDEPNGTGIALPNLSQPPPTQQQLDFLRAPPPNMGPPHLGPMFRGVPPPMNMPPFGPPPNARPSLLGMPPGNNFNPFAGNMPDMAMNSNFVGGGGGLMGPGPGSFNNFGPGIPPNMRNFAPGNNQQRNQRNQKRRNNNYGGGGGGGNQ